MGTMQIDHFGITIKVYKKKTYKYKHFKKGLYQYIYSINITIFSLNVLIILS